MKTLRRVKKAILFIGLLILGFAMLIACNSSEDSGSTDTDELMKIDHDEEMDHDDNDLDVIPNDGAVIRIISPSDGIAIKEGDDLLVEVETEDFILGENGNHWHIYIDGSSWGMVMGGNHDQVLRGLSEGEHEISVFMSIDTHEQLADGDSITVNVEK